MATKQPSEPPETETDTPDAQHDTLVLGLHHELRTPLTLISTAAELLEGGSAGALAPQQRLFVDQIREGVARALAVLDDLMDPTKHAVGGTHLPKGPNGAGT